MVVVPPGTFKMGDIQRNFFDSEKPVHTVSIAKPFAIGRYPITFDEYDRFASATSRPLPNDAGWGRGRQPAINVSWDDAVEYAMWLSGQTGKRYRLPTEAEWEYAARAGTETNYWWGNDMMHGMANYDVGSRWGDSRWGGKQTSPVGSFPANLFGLYDRAGNVWEWVQDDWHENYKGAPADGAAWEEKIGSHSLATASAWCAAVPGSTYRSSCARLSGTGSSPTSATTTLAFVLPRMLINSFLFVLFKLSDCCLLVTDRVHRMDAGWSPETFKVCRVEGR
jgi:formylglycine-generating enzyme required for sulfatase activity